MARLFESIYRIRECGFVCSEIVVSGQSRLNVSLRTSDLCAQLDGRVRLSSVMLAHACLVAQWRHFKWMVQFGLRKGDVSRLDPFTLHLTHAPICAADPLCANFVLFFWEVSRVVSYILYKLCCRWFSVISVEIGNLFEP